MTCVDSVGPGEEARTCVDSVGPGEEARISDLELMCM